MWSLLETIPFVSSFLETDFPLQILLALASVLQHPDTVLQILHESLGTVHLLKICPSFEKQALA